MASTNFKRILVPYDGSKFSKNALSNAINLAKNFSSEIYLITAIDTSEFPPGMLLGLLKKDKKLEVSNRVPFCCKIPS